MVRSFREMMFVLVIKCKRTRKLVTNEVNVDRLTQADKDL